MLSILREYAEDEDFQEEWNAARMSNKQRLADYIEKTQGLHIPTSFLFDVMVKRFHEYKRQLMDAMYCIFRYQWIKCLSPEERKKVVPRAVFFGGKVGYEIRVDGRLRLRIIEQRM